MQKTSTLFEKGLDFFRRICYDNYICVNGEVRLATSEHYQNSPLRAPHECS